MNPTPFSPHETKQRAQNKTLETLRGRLAAQAIELNNLRRELAAEVRIASERCQNHQRDHNNWIVVEASLLNSLKDAQSRCLDIANQYQYALQREQRLERAVAYLKVECAARLEKFGKHKTDCENRLSPTLGCTCGLAEAKVFV